MKRFFAILLTGLVLFASTTDITLARSTRTKASDVYVKGHTTKSGKYIKGYYRSAKDSSKKNNYSCIDHGKCK